MFNVYPDVHPKLFSIAFEHLQKRAKEEHHRILKEEIRESIIEYNLLTISGPINTPENWHYIYKVNCYDCGHIMTVRLGTDGKIKSSLLYKHEKMCTRFNCLK